MLLSLSWRWPPKDSQVLAGSADLGLLVSLRLPPARCRGWGPGKARRLAPHRWPRTAGPEAALSALEPG